MDIEVGESVRINNDSRNCVGIGKVIKTVNESIYVEMNNKYHLPVVFSINNIAKHRKQLIDLIEVGDYVNGNKVFATNNRINDNGEKVILTENYDEWTDNGVISNKDIKTIVTKEQFEDNCYKVGGEDE